MSNSGSLVDMINAKLTSGEVELPVFDEVALKVYRAVKKDDLSAEQICDLMEEDPVLVAEVLSTANSSFFSGLGAVNTIREAMVRLGGKQVGALAMAAGQKRLYSMSKGLYNNRLKKLWAHTSAVAMGSRWLARKAGYLNLSDEAYVGGLLHDVGKVSLLTIIEDLAAGGADSIEVSEHVVDVTIKQLHTQHGAQLLKLWNLPESFQEVVAQQDMDQFDESNIVLAIVRLVDKACAKEGISDFPDPGISLDSIRESTVLNLNDIVLAELQIVVEDAANGAEREAA
ncbi:MAG: HDOD domain-containing protein [Lysobacterales bacterium]